MNLTVAEVNVYRSEIKSSIWLEWKGYRICWSCHQARNNQKQNKAWFQNVIDSFLPEGLSKFVYFNVIKISNNHKECYLWIFTLLLICINIVMITKIVLQKIKHNFEITVALGLKDMLNNADKINLVCYVMRCYIVCWIVRILIFIHWIAKSRYN